MGSLGEAEVEGLPISIDYEKIFDDEKLIFEVANHGEDSYLVEAVLPLYLWNGVGKDILSKESYRWGEKADFIESNTRIIFSASED